MKETVVVAMSGGVDSSTAAHLLVSQGYNVIGVTMKLPYVGDDEQGVCCGVKGIERARTVAHTLGIPWYVVNYEEAFERDVIAYFCREYACGKTPNPCVVCNEKIKFGVLRSRAQELGAQYIATGHYAQREYDSARNMFVLKKGADPKKDQSYFLFSLTQEQLAHTLFPLGTYTKDAVRTMAHALHLVAHDVEESQEICFIPDNDYVKFLQHVHKDRTQEYDIAKGFIPGNIVTRDGVIVGKHQGIALYTIGQRKGIGAHGGKRYVIAVQPEHNQVMIGEEKDLYSSRCVVDAVHWIDGSVLGESRRVLARIRYKHEESDATITPLTDTRVQVVFDAPQRAITPGQAMVFFDGDVVLGGGWIEGMQNAKCIMHNGDEKGNR